MVKSHARESNPRPLRNTARDLPDHLSAGEIEIRGPNAMVHNPIDGLWNPVNPARRGGRPRGAPRAISTRARRAETQKNGQSTHADGGSMGPSALDQEIGTTWSCVPGRQISRGLRSMPRQWQCREIAGPRVHRTPLGAGWDWPPSLAVAACWQQLC